MRIMHIFWRFAFLAVTAILIGFVNPSTSSAAAMGQTSAATCRGNISIDEATRCLTREGEQAEKRAKMTEQENIELVKKRDLLRQENADAVKRNARLDQRLDCLNLMRQSADNYRKNHTAEETREVYTQIYYEYVKMESDPSIKCPVR